MPRDKRPFIMVTDTMPEHPKIEPLSDSAFRLVVTTWCYCSRLMNDGVMTRAAWVRRGTPKARRELEEAGLVEDAGDGMVRIHDYTQHQRTAAEVQALSDKRAAAGAAGGKAKAANRLASATSKPLASAKQKPSKSLANGYQTSSRVEKRREETTASGGAAPQRETSKGLANASDGPTVQDLVAEWIDHCPGGRPKGSIVGMVAKRLQALVNDGADYAELRTALQHWQQRGLHPSALDAVFHELRTAGASPNRANSRPVTSPGGFDPAAALARAQAAAGYRLDDGSEQPPLPESWRAS